MVADDLVTQVARPSTAMVLTYFDWNTCNLISVPEGSSKHSILCSRQKWNETWGQSIHPIQTSSCYNQDPVNSNEFSTMMMAKYITTEKSLVCEYICQVAHPVSLIKSVFASTDGHARLRLHHMGCETKEHVLYSVYRTSRAGLFSDCTPQEINCISLITNSMMSSKLVPIKNDCVNPGKEQAHISLRMFPTYLQTVSEYS